MPRYLFVLLLSALSPAAQLDRPAPGDDEGNITSVVASLLEHSHLTATRLDDEASKRWFEAYIEDLDGARLYFLQSDIDGFQQWATTLDDNLHRARANDLEPAYVIYETYLERARERAEFAIEVADDDFDFTDHETFDFDRSDEPWPATKAEQDDLWRRYVKEQRLRGALWDRKPEDQIKRIVERFEDQIQSINETESLDVLEAYLSALSQVHDPHTSYFKPARLDNFNIDLSNSVEGIGAVLRRADEFTKVVELVPGGPAEKGKQLEVGDRIIAVAQGADEPVDILDTRIDKVVKLIRGKKGSEVRLTVIPTGATTGTTKVVTIIRDRVQLESSRAKTEVVTVPDTTTKVAVVNVPNFYAPVAGGGVSRVSGDVREQIEAVASDVQVVVIDLRENSGGSLAEAIDLTGLFIDKGPVVQVKGRRGEVEVYRDRDGGTVWDGPLIVLTSQLSASASEIFAAAIQDYGRGIVVGSAKTHGKGTVQTVVYLDELMAGMLRPENELGAGMLKLTTQQFYRVNGASTQARGVAADIVLPSPYETVHTYEGDIDHAMKWDQVEPAPIKSVAELSAVIADLKKRSTVRVAADPELQAIAKANAWQTAEKEKGGVVSLNLEERKRERDEIDALLGAEPDEDSEEPVEAPKEDAPDPGLEETLRIAQDWLTLKAR